MRDVIERKTKERHLLRAAELPRKHGLTQLKLYMMLGLPGETDDDIDELARFSARARRGIAPRWRSGSRPSSPSATRRSTARRSRASR